uniref:Uncharacterized protein MANES_13G059700 n=1 Tax=Rhizophora mucronata TaxID=61149 RepID=A0A2P2KA20_RHIMU
MLTPPLKNPVPPTSATDWISRPPSVPPATKCPALSACKNL